jgi:hypothetical protein
LRFAPTANAPIVQAMQFSSLSLLLLLPALLAGLRLLRATRS